MVELNESSARGLGARWLEVAEETVAAWELLGGVSNLVYRVRAAGRPDLILKQSLAKLRVKEDWFSDRSRIFQEIDALRELGKLATPGALPEILFEDRANYLFAMSAAEEEAPTWKEELLAGRVDVGLAVQAAELHATFFQAGQLRERFEGLALFDQLRLDPYYRFTAQRHPDLARYFAQAIARCQEDRRALTHGDWSPKNFLVNAGARLFSIDYEVMHWGDPGFDTAFLLNHFLLKAWHRAGDRALYAGAALAYWSSLSGRVGADWLEASTICHLGCLHLARVDGKSPAEYLRPTEQAQARRFARELIQNPPGTVGEIFAMQAEAFHE